VSGGIPSLNVSSFPSWLAVYVAFHGGQSSFFLHVKTGADNDVRLLWRDLLHPPLFSPEFIRLFFKSPPFMDRERSTQHSFYVHVSVCVPDGVSFPFFAPNTVGVPSGQRSVWPLRIISQQDFFQDPISRKSTPARPTPALQDPNLYLPPTFFFFFLICVTGLGSTRVRRHWGLFNHHPVLPLASSPALLLLTSPSLLC